MAHLNKECVKISSICDEVTGKTAKEIFYETKTETDRHSKQGYNHMNIHVQNNKQVLDLLKCFFILSHKSAQPDPVSWFITQ